MPKACVAKITRTSPRDEALLNRLAGLRRPAGMEVVGRDVVDPQEGGDLLGAPPGRAVDNGPPGVCGGSSFSSLWWMRANFSPPLVGATANFRLVRCAPPSKTRRSMPSLSRKCTRMSSRTAGLAVRQSTGVAPARQAVGLVEDPGANLALVEGAAHPDAARLLGRG